MEGKAYTSVSKQLQFLIKNYTSMKKNNKWGKNLIRRILQIHMHVGIDECDADLDARK